MSGSSNTLVKCGDCEYHGENGLCVRPGSTEGRTHWEYACGFGVAKTIAVVEKPEPEDPPTTSMTLWGYPVRTDPTMKEDELRFEVGQPLIEQAVDTPLLDALAEKYRRIAERYPDGKITFERVQEYDSDPNSFTGEELRASPVTFAEYLQRISPGPDDELGGYLIPASYQQAILRYFQAEQATERVFRRYVFGRDAKISIGYAGPGDEIKWQDLGGVKQAEVVVDGGVRGSDHTVKVTWEEQPYGLVVVDEWHKPSEHQKTTDEIGQEVWAELKDKIRQTFIDYLNEHIENQFLYGNPDAPSHGLDWQSVGDILAGVLQPASEHRRAREGDWPTYDFTVCELDRLDTERDYYPTMQYVLGESDPGGIRSVRHVGRLELEAGDSRFGYLVNAFHEHREVRVSYCGRIYTAIVKYVEPSELVMDKAYPMRQFYNVAFDVFVPPRQSYHRPYTRENPGFP